MYKLLFLTGLPRSGTTWLASILGTHKELNYISGEVFNPGTSHETFGLEGLPWFLKENQIDDKLKKDIPKALSLEVSIRFTINRLLILLKKGNLNPKNYLRVLKHLYFASNSKPIFTKDPIGFFMTKYIYQHYNARIIIVKRDPYRFAASMKRMNWFLNFNHLPLSYKKKYQKEIESFKREKKDLVLNVIIWWLIFEDYTKSLITTGTPFLEIRHEDVINDPEFEFNKILKYYGFAMDKQVKSKIDYYIALKGNGNKIINETHQMNRSKSQIKNSWKNYLSDEEVDMIKKMTGIYPPK